jgi:hypothetical protein
MEGEHRPYSVNELAKEGPQPGSCKYLILPQTSFCVTTMGIKNTNTLDELQARITQLLLQLTWIGKTLHTLHEVIKQDIWESATFTMKNVCLKCL